VVFDTTEAVIPIIDVELVVVFPSTAFKSSPQASNVDCDVCGKPGNGISTFIVVVMVHCAHFLHEVKNAAELKIKIAMIMFFILLIYMSRFLSGFWPPHLVTNFKEYNILGFYLVPLRLKLAKVSLF
jgi:hypothetical protein